MKKYPLTVCTIVWMGDQILMSQRKKTPEFSGFWQCPGGKVDSDDESIAFAAAREVKEETGLYVYQWHLNVLDCIYDDPSSDKHFIFNWQTHDGNFSQVTNKEKGKATAWQLFTPEEALALKKLMPGLRQNISKKPLVSF
jgi:8-oxo-dGTP pyrophosphatase MutT (NUDIX family)